MRLMPWMTGFVGVVACWAAEPQTVPAAAPNVAPGITSARGGLTVRALVDKPRAVPDDVVTMTLLCRNSGPAVATGVRVEQTLPAGLDMVPQPLQPGARWEAANRKLIWQMTDLAVEQEQTISFQTLVSTATPGTSLAATPSVRAAGDVAAHNGQSATTEVVSGALVATVALPDVMIARAPLGRGLIDVGTPPGQALVERLIGLGVIAGFPDGTFKPNQPVTRAQATKMLVATVQLAGLRDNVSLSVLLARPAKVDISVADSQGREVRHLADGLALPAGSHQIVWDGRDGAQRAVGVGVYRYTVTATDDAGLAQKLDGTVNVVTVQPLPKDLVSSFKDVPRDAWYRPYVAAAEEKGIVRGYPGRRFNPSQPISRVENTVMVVRAAGLTAEAEKRVNTALGFTDANKIPKWAVGYVAVATASTSDGDGNMFAVAYDENKFLPEQTLGRGEAASVLERLLDRQAPSEVPVSGRIARGHELSLNGSPVTATEGGRFRRAMSLAPASPTVAISAH